MGRPLRNRIRGASYIQTLQAPSCEWLLLTLLRSYSEKRRQSLLHFFALTLRAGKLPLLVFRNTHRLRESLFAFFAGKLIDRHPISSKVFLALF